jgi:hypothetical protein
VTGKLGWSRLEMALANGSGHQWNRKTCVTRTRSIGLGHRAEASARIGLCEGQHPPSRCNTMKKMRRTVILRKFLALFHMLASAS